MTRIATLLVLLVLINPAQSEPFEVQPINRQLQVQPVLKPNLVIDAFGWNAEFCGLYGCAAVDQMKQDLQIDKATCPLVIRIRNTGNAPTGAFVVRVDYYHWKGTALLQKHVSVGSGLGPGETRVVSIPAGTIGYFHTGKPFTATVDANHQVAESNETDNTATMPNP